MSKTSGNPSTKKTKAQRKTKTRRTTKRGKSPRDRSERKIQNSQDMNEMERASLVVDLFCKDKKVGEIVDALVEKYGEAGRISREKVYKILRRAGVKGWLRYQPPLNLVYTHQIRSHYRFLSDVQVVSTTLSKDVANAAARTLLRLVKERTQGRNPKQEVHLGIAGGISMRHLAMAFAEELWQPNEDLPEKIVFHSMNAGFDPKDPSTDPNAFVSYYVNEAAMPPRCEFVGLHAPSMVFTKGLNDLKALVQIREAYEGVEDLDIIVTSGADWDDPDNSLRQSMEDYPNSLDAFPGYPRSPDAPERKGQEEDWVGDMFWRPLNMHGPIETQTEVRAMTLLELSDLPGFIKKGGDVLLVLGPCGACNRPKGRLLQNILNLKERLLTHAVVDSRTARDLLTLENIKPLEVSEP